MAASEDATPAQGLAARLRAALRDLDETMKAIAAAMAEHGKRGQSWK